MRENRVWVPFLIELKPVYRVVTTTIRHHHRCRYGYRVRNTKYEVPGTSIDSL